ncbi:MAG: DUF5906 domain-containing protein [Sulfuricurvum sp.]|nr:DUF5906 domain-containing protein [Sulfuricurvum sp.]
MSAIQEAQDRILQRMEECEVGLEDQTISQKRNKGDFSAFVANNWQVDTDNETLNDLNHKGVALWINKDGDISYRFKADGEISTTTQGKASNVFSAQLKREVNFFAKKAEVQKQELRLVKMEIFDPQGTKEFTDRGERNVFKPTKYLMTSGTPSNEPKAILKLIRHLCNNEEIRTAWVLNWLACFFQTLDKAQTALVLYGEQGTGKGILFNEVIMPLFGELYVATIDDKTLSNSKYLGGLIENRLFLNLDEVTHDKKGSQEVKNFLKALITGKILALDQKHKNITKETPLFAQVLVTSNSHYVLEIEPNDRRYTVIKTGGKLNQCNWLGYHTDSGILNAIKSELADFALYLKGYEADLKARNIAMDTPEKRALIENSTDKFTLFVHTLKNKDIGYFSDTKVNPVQLISIKENFQKNRVHKESLTRLFNDSNDGEEISAKKLMKVIRSIDPLLFSESNVVGSDGQRYYLLP